MALPPTPLDALAKIVQGLEVWSEPGAPPLVAKASLAQLLADWCERESPRTFDRAKFLRVCGVELK